MTRTKLGFYMPCGYFYVYFLDNPDSAFRQPCSVSWEFYAQKLGFIDPPPLQATAIKLMETMLEAQAAFLVMPPCLCISFMVNLSRPLISCFLFPEMVIVTDLRVANTEYVKLAYYLFN
ncbi:hypothetical protein SAY87_007789 [Trapa incisa]|uniref:Uncharacterized protein n=1 Tax=Trapa incisa TaxID=236973 RepID=A0AAN7KNM2_9MYRT|nr:hypothetical protein SAY87_007789 [Trapa incisa]